MESYLVMDTFKDFLTPRRAEIRIGRGSDNHIILYDLDVFEQHAVIHREGRQVILHDLGSPIGNFQCDKTIERVVLSHRDTFRVGHISFRFLTKRPFNAHKQGDTPYVARTLEVGIKPTICK